MGRKRTPQSGTRTHHPLASRPRRSDVGVEIRAGPTGMDRLVTAQGWPLTDPFALAGGTAGDMIVISPTTPSIGARRPGTCACALLPWSIRGSSSPS
jgi:hypothetical protein